MLMGSIPLRELRLGIHHQALDMALQILQLRPVLNHSSPDIPNSASSCSTEFEGGCIAHAAGGGGFGHDGIVTGNDDFDAQPAAIAVSSRIQTLKTAV